MPEVGIIGGSGFYELLEEPQRLLVDTPFGQVKISVGVLEGREVAFIARHGERHEIPPFMVNYRANILALRMLGVVRILATNAVGAINPELTPGTIVIPDDFIDFTKCRATTFYDGKTKIRVGDRIVGGVVHVSMTPSTYCPELRRVLLEAGKELGLEVVDGGVYVCAEGNRFETPAEIRAFRVLGGDVVGMTGCPEAALAREVAACYATVNVVTNYAAGVSGPLKLTHEEVKEVFSKRIDDVKALLRLAVAKIPPERKCACKDALEGAVVEA
ncbi:MAG TPA: S-methyl-5'-thioinosine phosphorylase [Candidatus Korarchaeota archaeon]|nr:S-methyl-5'-thioinosine phosphorylase [Candidatus Korarchaeota archaeon]